MKTRNEICGHCGFEIGIRNPSGKCDHLYYPENCNTCSGRPHLTAKPQSLNQPKISETKHDKMVRDALNSINEANKDVPKEGRTFKSKYQHTPAPWYDNRSDRTIRSIENMTAWQRPNEKQKKFIICKYPLRSSDYPISHEEWEANARLIAAAPTLKAENERLMALNLELLEACKALIGPGKNMTFMQAVGLAKQAIAKAEGSSHA